MIRRTSPRTRFRLVRSARRVLDGLADDAPLMCGCDEGVCDCDAVRVH